MGHINENITIFQYEDMDNNFLIFLIMTRICSKLSANGLFYFAEETATCPNQMYTNWFCIASIKIEKGPPHTHTTLILCPASFCLLRNHHIDGSISSCIFNLFYLKDLLELTPVSPLPTLYILVCLPLSETAPGKFANNLQYSVDQGYFIRFWFRMLVMGIRDLWFAEEKA